MRNHLVLALFFSLSNFTLYVHADNDFPYREHFSDVSVMELSDLEREYDDVYIIDVRSRLEFNVLHMDKAVNIPMSTRGFELEAKNLMSKNLKIVTYCNGHTCKKSYEAVKRLSKIGLNNVHAFDAGIFDWTRANPDKSVLLGTAPVDLEKIISKDKLTKHSLNYNEFMTGANSSTSVLFDVRDHFQRKKEKKLKGARAIPMDKIHSWLIANKNIDKTLYIYDATGKQVRWLQYYLENQGMKNYFFLKGGINNKSNIE